MRFRLCRLSQLFLQGRNPDGSPRRESGRLIFLADPEMHDLWEHLRLGYTESWGHPLLRHEIASLYQGIDQLDVLTVVPEEGIYLTMRALLSVIRAPGTLVPHSLSTRLVLLFTVSTTIVFVLLGVSLQQMLRIELTQRDIEELQSRVKVVVHHFEDIALFAEDHQRAAGSQVIKAD